MPGLYIHMPFCASACPYCDFAFVVGRDALRPKYTDALITEIERRHTETGDSLDTIYFGGGTPSAVEPADLARILSVIHRIEDVSQDAEITVEANPNDRHKFGDLYRAGVTRLSLGIQSTDDGTLKGLGRSHTGKDASGSVEKARKAGFANLNVDAIFGNPGQTVSQWRDDLTDLIALGPDHISIYGLTIEPRTRFAKQQSGGQLALPDENTQSAMYDIALELTEKAGILQYEISNFAKPGHESRHNLSCWRGDTYAGFGLSAHSYSGNWRSWNVRNMNAYLDRIEGGETAEEGSERIADKTNRIERIMLGLRTRDGIDPSLLDQDQTSTRLLSENLLEKDGTRLRLTRRGKHVADLVCAELVRNL